MQKPKPLYGPVKSLLLFLGILAMRWIMMVFSLANTALFFDEADILNQFLQRKLFNDALGRYLSPVFIILTSSLLLTFFSLNLPTLAYTLIGFIIANVLYFYHQSLWTPILFAGLLGLYELSGGLEAVARLILP